MERIELAQKIADKLMAEFDIYSLEEKATKAEVSDSILEELREYGVVDDEYLRDLRIDREFAER
jgi:hypothetical protein